jgi:hypothetical protein
VSPHEAPDPNRHPPFLDERLLLANARVDEIERQQREYQKEQTKIQRGQLRVNVVLAIFTAALVGTRVVFNIT